MDHEDFSPNEEEAPLNENENNLISSSFSASGEGLSDDFKLGIAFVLMVIVGTATSVLSKLVAIPLYNYPNFINIFNLVLYLVVCFGYIIPMTKFGTLITKEQMQFPKRSFALMGALDTLSISVQQISCVYLSGPLTILLPQAAIPISMIFSRKIKGERFHYLQYLGAAIVTAGIVIVLGPMFSHSNTQENVCQTNSQVFDPDEYCTLCQVETTQEGCLAQTYEGSNSTLSYCEWVPQKDSTAAAEGSKDAQLVTIWSLIVIVSCIPMTLSSLYKEMVLFKIELDAFYLNGWTSFFQFFYSLILAIPAGMASSPPVSPEELPQNMKDAWKCYFYGTGTIDTGCHPDDSCGHAFWLFNLTFVLIVVYTVLTVYLLKYGSTSLFYLALTITVPLGNLAFCLPITPGYTPMHVSDIIGLLVIVAGLILYRSFSASQEDLNVDTDINNNNEQIGETSNATLSLMQSTMESLQEPLLTPSSD